MEPPSSWPAKGLRGGEAEGLRGEFEGLMGAPLGRQGVGAGSAEEDAVVAVARADADGCLPPTVEGGLPDAATGDFSGASSTDDGVGSTSPIFSRKFFLR
mmetsp:Transcript_56588/g.148854  ORF Transcript_56588/g.148854 Transcript_56588/m.148854 type:complete len:100 (+) Transcript_56588:357-656(+)